MVYILDICIIIEYTIVSVEVNISITDRAPIEGFITLIG